MKLNFFAYFGGKSKLAKDLIPRFPSHSCYVEVFGGAGNVLLQKPPSKVEVFNDLNSDIVNLFRQVRENFDAFYEQILLCLYSREEYHRFSELLSTETDDLNRALMFYVVAQQSFGGKFGNYFSVDKRGRCWASKLPRLACIQKRLLPVIIENMGFEKVLRTYDSPDTFFYLDPPYLPETRRGGRYENEMTYEDHEYLIFLLRTLKGKFMLSGYPNELYDSEGWMTKEFQVSSHVDQEKQKQKRTEKIWCNYPIEKQTLLF